MKKILFILAAFTLFISPAYATGMMKDQLPAPKTIRPLDNVDLTGKMTLEFRWSGEGSGNRVYRFRIFKGPSPVESAMILKKEFPAGQTGFEAPTDLFTAGETYSWSIRQVGGTKSDLHYSVFKIVKK